uniref:Uncharacterized protein n=1 Tax=Hyaloperonospora arabidopsidis (strain Emoy2) TaxID=559515 RepID=M4BW66_HYAAE
MFNPAKYPPQERIRLGAICVEKRGQVDTRQLRDGTDDEWKIIQGLAGGDIVGRRLPPFLASIFNHSELLRFHSTIQSAS